MSKGQTLKNFIKKIVKFPLYRVISFVECHPRLRLTTVSVIRKLGLDAPLFLVYRRLTGARKIQNVHSGITNAENLSPHSSRIYINLRNAVERHKQGNR